MQLSPDAYNALADRADCMVALKSFDNALSDYSAALAKFPDSAKILRRRAALYEQLGDVESALKDRSKAEELSEGSQSDVRDIFDFFD